MMFRLRVTSSSCLFHWVNNESYMAETCVLHSYYNNNSIQIECMYSTTTISNGMHLIMDNRLTATQLSLKGPRNATARVGEVKTSEHRVFSEHKEGKFS